MSNSTLFFLLFVCIAGKSFGQEIQAKATSEAEVPAYPVSLYKQATIMSQNLYNGRQYYIYDPRSEEHQFFIERKWKKGVVRYDNQQFDSIPMMYDIFRDELVIKHFNGDNLLLQSEKVDFFILDNHDFLWLESGKDINSQMRTGFYDVLYKGKSRTLVRRTKQRQEKIVDKRVISLYPAKSFYYILKDGQYHFVNTKRSVLNLFPEHKREMRRVLREEKIRFRKQKDIAITSMVAAYDETAKP